MTTKFANAIALVLARPTSSAVAHPSQGTTAAPAHGATVRTSAPAENDHPTPHLWDDREHIHANVTTLYERVKHVPLTEELRAQLRSLMSDEEADRQGMRVTTGDLLLDVVDDVPAVVEAVVAGEVAGFGPGALRYTCELAVELVGRWCAHVVNTMTRADASSRRRVTVDDVNECVTALARRLDGVLPSGTPEREALAAAIRQRSRSADEALAVVEALLPLVAKVFQRGAAESGYRALLHDARFTEASIATLLQPVREAVDARAAHRAARSAEATTQQQLTRLEGRLRGQLMRLRACVEAARAEGGALQEVKLTRSRVRTTKKATETKRDGTQGGGPTPVAAPK